MRKRQILSWIPVLLVCVLMVTLRAEAGPRTRDDSVDTSVSVGDMRNM